MIGKIVILNSKDNFGKVIFEDGNESKVIKFPEHFENNDEIDISFKNNDLSGQVTKMIAHKRDNYGVVVSIFNQGIGKVLVTYPQLSGLVNFKHFSPAQQGLNLRFDIQKTINSQEAINIQVAKESEFYRCNTPTFGHIILPKLLVLIFMIFVMLRQKENKKIILHTLMSTTIRSV